jgi:poly(3-hydroxyalkanoate) synthetase
MQRLSGVRPRTGAGHDCTSCRPDPQFFAKQWLGMMAPANWLATNPVVLRDAMAQTNGTHLTQGLRRIGWLIRVRCAHTR